MDPAKLKVIELRQELASRGLDQKGVKAVLVSRLREALDAENAQTPSECSVSVRLWLSVIFLFRVQLISEYKRMEWIENDCIVRLRLFCTITFRHFD